MISPAVVPPLALWGGTATPIHTRALAGHRNNFTLLRLALAGCVVCVHLYTLSRSPYLKYLGYLDADLAVNAFFVLSGYLVTQSYLSSQDLTQYGVKRIRRLYPAYALSVLMSVVIGTFLTTAPLATYLRDTVVRFIPAQLLFLTFLRPNLTGVFQHNPVSMVNGALWTIKIEIMFYIALPALLWCLRKMGWASIGLVYAGSVAYRMILLSVSVRSGSVLYNDLGRQLPGQLCFFVSGVFMFYNWSTMERRKHVCAALATLAAVIAHQVPVLFFLEPAAMAVLIVYLGRGVPYLSILSRLGDFSYGLYVLHFPIIQTLVALGLFRALPVAGAIFAAGIALACAMLSWRYIESPFLLGSERRRLLRKER